MSPVRKPTLRTVAIRVGDTLRRAGIDAVLTGGACASIHSGGRYHSLDVDFVIRSRVSQAELDDALATVGFKRHRDRYVHPGHPYFVEFPRGPLGIGGDLDIRPVRLRFGTRSMNALSATDSCRDRLAAFYHWNDRQSLKVAVAIALRNPVQMARIRRWSAAEGALDQFHEFRRLVAERRPAGRGGRSKTIGA